MCTIKTGCRLKMNHTKKDSTQSFFETTKYNSYFVVLASHQQELDGFYWHYQASATVLSSAVNNFQQCQEINSWEPWESNPELLGEELVCYLCAMCYLKKDSYGISLHDRGAMDYLLRPGSTWRCCGPRPTPASRRRACWRWRRWPPRGRRTQPGCFLKSEARDSNQEPAAFAKVEQYDWLTHLRPITRALAKRGSIAPKTIIQKRVFTLKSVEARVRVSFYTNYQWGDSMTHRRPDVSTEKKVFLQKFWTKKKFWWYAEKKVLVSSSAIFF